MSRISRYVMRQILGPLGFFLAALTAMVWLFQSLDFLDLLINKGQSVEVFLRFAAFITPSVLGVVLPIALLCAVIYGLNRLKNDSELIVIWASGMSRWTVARPVLVIALGIVGIMYALSLELTPLGQRSFRHLAYELREDLASALLQEGKFNTPSDDLTIYIRERRSADDLAGILVHDTRQPDAPISYLAEQGRLVRDQDAPRIVMVNGTIQRVDPNTGAVSILDFDRYNFDMSQFMETTSLLRFKPSHRSTAELLDPASYAETEKEARKFVWELHMRLSTPLYALIFALLGLVALLNPRFSRQSQIWPVVGAAGAAIFVRATGYYLRDQISKDPVFILALYGFLGAVIVLLLIMIQSEHIMPRFRRRPAPLPAE